MMDSIIAISIAIAKPFSHQVVALVIALSVQLFHPDSRSKKATLAITATSLVIGYLTYLLSADTSIASYITHTLAAVGGGLATAFLSQIIMVGENLSNNKELAKRLSDRIADKLETKKDKKDD